MVDKLASTERERAFADARSVLSELLGESVTRWFEALCPEHRYFAISSAGLSPGTVEPVRVSEVLDWVVTRGRAVSATKDRTRDNVAVVRAVGPTPPVAAGSTQATSASTLRESGSPPNGARARSRSSTLALRAGMLAFAGLAGFGTYTVLHRAPQPTTSSGEVSAPADTTARRESAPEVRPQGGVQANDSAGAVEAFRRLAHASGVELTRWADTARARASRVLESGPAGSRVLAPMHYIRARACGVPMLHCDRHRVIDDYSWVRAHGTLAQREEARRALDTLVVRRRHAAR
jgi:hypothetical protein